MSSTKSRSKAPRQAVSSSRGRVSTGSVSKRSGQTVSSSVSRGRTASSSRSMPIPSVSLSKRSTRLAPGDPQAINTATFPGGNNVGNTIITDTNYAMSQDDQRVIVVQTGATITLPTEPLLGYPTYIVADGGTVIVNGPIHGGALTVPEGTIVILVYSSNSGEWSFVAGSPPSEINLPFQTFAANGSVAQENTLASVTVNAVVVTLPSGFRVCTVRDRTGSPTPSIVFTAADGQVESPNALGTFGATGIITTPNGAVTWRWNGTVYEIISTT